MGLDDCRSRAYLATMLPTLSQITALASVIIIDVVLAGDNAIVVGMAAAGLPVSKRRRVILMGIGVATVLRIAFAAVALQLLSIIGLALAGGILLLWVAWKFYRELRDAQAVRTMAGGHGDAPAAREKTSMQAVIQIVLADLSMSLDNVLAVAGVARTQAEPWVLFTGLALSVALMGFASNLIARLLAHQFWLSWVGLAIITAVALRMIWAGSGEVLGHAGVL
jgi:YjbE family integral membrane protein